MSSSRATAAASFAAGAAAALLSVVLYQQAQQRRQTRRRRQQQQQQQQRHTYSSDADTSTGSSDEQSSGGGGQLFDSPGLDQRMIRKAEGAIRLRTSRLVVVIERCTNDHNYSAIHRTAEALGVQHIYVISPPSLKTLEGGDVDADGDGGGEGNTGTSRLLAVGKGGRVVKQANQDEVADRALHHLFAQRATEWLEVHEFDSTAECLAALREGGYRVWATDLSQEAVRLEEEDLRAAAAAAAARGGAPGDGGDDDARPIPDRLAIVFGTEAVGCTAEMLREADLRVYLPLRGFADSLNLSVATALVVHHLFLLDPTLIGAMPEEERRALRKKWYAALCRQRLLSSGKKRERSRLLGKVRDGERYERIIASGGTLDTRQAQKLQGKKDAKAQLDKLDEELDAMAEKAVSLLVDNPPEPLSDMRRADEHRITHVGKGTKKKNADAWAGMPATAKTISIVGPSSSFFRAMVSEANGGK